MNIHVSLTISAILSSTMLKISTTSSLSLPPRLPPLRFNETFQFGPTAATPISRKIRLRVSSSESYKTVVDVAPTPETNEGGAADVVRSFYQGINSRDFDSVEKLIADNCVYEDLIFPQPFIGRKAILEFFKNFSDSISTDLQFVIDDISTEDSSVVGVTWHLEWKGKQFPFSKGCSFYRLEVVNGKKQIIYGRDIVEPAIKPGKSALGIIRAVTWLLQQFPQLADRLR